MNDEQTNILLVAGLVDIGVGGFLIIDSLFLHLLSFNYAGLGLVGSPYFHHAFIGLFVLGLGIALIFMGQRYSQ